MIDEKTYLEDRARWRRHWYETGRFGADTVSRVLASAVQQRPDTEFHYYRSGDPQGPAVSAVVTAAQLWEQARGLAGALHAQGIRAGDVVAVQLPTWRETTAIYLALLRLGALLIPIVHSYRPREMEFILRESGAQTLVIPGHWRGEDYPRRLAEVVAPALKRIIVVDEDAPAGMLSWPALLASAGGDCPEPRQSPDDPCLLIYTSGTTASPKGVLFSHNSLQAEWRSRFFHTAGPYLCNFPAGHIAGFNFALRPLITATPVVYLDHWDPALAVELIRRHRICESGGNGFFLRGLIKAAEGKAAEGKVELSGIRLFGMGGTGVTPAEIELAEAHGIRAGRVYGSTEHSTVTRTDPDFALAQRATTDGVPVPGNQVRIVDDEGRELGPGALGEIVTQGPELFIGYTDMRLNLENFLPGGWFRTGDLGCVDGQGFLTVTDRKKDIIIRGGENISAKEVEEVLSTHPAVEEAAVTAMPDADYGERVCAFVRLKPGRELDLDGVRRHFAAAGTARHKIPERVMAVDDFPRTPAGKIKKHVLRQRLNDTAGDRGQD